MSDNKNNVTVFTVMLCLQITKITSTIPLARKYLSIHFIFQDLNERHCNQQFVINFVNITGLDNTKCSPLSVFQRMSSMTKREKIMITKYPINFARNYARRSAKTYFILIADFDHYFSDNFERKMLNLALQILIFDPKQVLVYRIFEIDENAKWPRNKTELFELMEENKAVTFHELFNNGGHKISYLKEWFQHQEYSINKTSIQFYQM